MGGYELAIFRIKANTPPLQEAAGFLLQEALPE
jgi:hypothetical protein